MRTVGSKFTLNAAKSSDRTSPPSRRMERTTSALGSFLLARHKGSGMELRVTMKDLEPHNPVARPLAATWHHEDRDGDAIVVKLPGWALPERAPVQLAAAKSKAA